MESVGASDFSMPTHIFPSLQMEPKGSQRGGNVYSIYMIIHECETENNQIM